MLTLEGCGHRTVTVTFLVLCRGTDAAEPTAAAVASAAWMSADALAEEGAAELSADVRAVLSGALQAQPLFCLSENEHAEPATASEVRAAHSILAFSNTVLPEGVPPEPESEPELEPEPEPEPEQ